MVVGVGGLEEVSNAGEMVDGFLAALWARCSGWEVWTWGVAFCSVELVLVRLMMCLLMCLQMDVTSSFCADYGKNPGHKLGPGLNLELAYNAVYASAALRVCALSVHVVRVQSRST